ncbi:MAG: hypothetical protein KatS3mg095_0673 [Candidatus Parcubacteria bacterium]|nr:MAG: hypothetical protein KatS3mg095_0673 [Candidatus Parcubacteria bacterium]
MKLRKIKLNRVPFVLVLYFFLFILINSILIYHFYKLQVVKAVNSSLISSNFEKITPLRGNIYLIDKDGNKFLVATTLYFYDLYFYPPQAKNVLREIDLIQTKVKLDDLDLTNLTSTKKSILLKKNLSYEQKKAIDQLNLSSVFFEEKLVRYYPFKDMLSTVLGFANLNSQTGLLEGQYGLERYYNEILKGEIGYRDKTKIIKNAKKGNDLILNIDYYLQKKSEEILNEAIKNYQAQGGLILIVETKTGNILAAAEYPRYDLNEYHRQNDYSIFVSRLSTNYEPGSVLKPFFYAAAFAENLATPSTTYHDLGYVNLNGWRIENFDKKGRGTVDLKTALEQSLNTGSVYISQLLGKSKFLKYIDLFRLNSKAEVDFPILEKPNFSNLYPPQGREVNFGTASFGQGVALSPLNLIQSFLVFANHGQIMKLNFAKKIIYFDETTKDIKSKSIAKTLDNQTLEKILPILEGVVINQAKKSRIVGYSIGGKTGSALIPKAKENISDPSGYTDEAITNFIGFFPLTDPKYLILVRLDKPSKGLLAFGTAAPTFREIAKFVINYYGLEPDKPEEIVK